MVNPWLTDTVTALRDEGSFVPVVLTFEPPGQLHDDLRERGIEALSLRVPPKVTPAAIVALRRALGKRRPAIVHTHVLEPAAVYALGGLFTRRPWVATRHQQPGFIDLAPIPAWKKWAFKYVDSRLHRAMNAVVAISARSARELRAMGVALERIVQIPLGFDLARLRPPPDRIAAARDTVADRNERIVVVVARLSWEKNLDRLIRAWADVVASVANARLVIVGSGPLENSLRETARATGVAPHITFTGHRSDAIELIGGADVVVQPSLTENMSMVAIEALAQGRALVTSPVGIAGEHMLDNVHCLIAPAHDEERLAATISRVLTDRAEAERLGAAGKRLVEDRFTAAQMARSYAGLYARITRSTG